MRFLYRVVTLEIYPVNIEIKNLSTTPSTVNSPSHIHPPPSIIIPEHLTVNPPLILRPQSEFLNLKYDKSDWAQFVRFLSFYFSFVPETRFFLLIDNLFFPRESNILYFKFVDKNWWPVYTGTHNIGNEGLENDSPAQASLFLSFFNISQKKVKNKKSNVMVLIITLSYETLFR